MAKRSDIAKPAPAVPGEMPAWLSEAASPTLIPGLRWAINREATYPSRPKLLQRLGEIEDAAWLLMRELRDLQILALLLDGDERIENENEMYHGLKDMGARAARVRERNPRKQGRGKLYPDPAAGPNLMEHCALIYAVVHHREFGTWPKNDANARQACEALWKQAGGPQRAGWGTPGSVAVWKRHLTAAQEYQPPHPAGKLIERILSPDTPDIRRRPARKADFPSKF